MADDKYKSAGNIRAKITRFDFEDTAKANLAMAKQVGDVASVIEKKSDEQNRRFDKLLKVLEFLPKDAMEKRKQDKIVFTELAKTVATLEKAAKETTGDRRAHIQRQANDLRKEGRKLSPDFDKSKPQGIKEWGYKILGLNPQRARENGLGSEIAQTVLPTFTGIAKKFSNKNSFDRAVEQEKMYPELTAKNKKVGFEARLRGGIKDTNETGIKAGKERSTGGNGDSIGGAVLRRIADAVVEIRNHIVGKKGTRGPDGDFKDAPPKGLFTDEENAKRDPKNWKYYKQRDKKGRYTGKMGKVWNRKSQWTGRGIKADDPDLPPPEPEVLGLHTGIELTEEQKARAGGSFDDHTEQQKTKDETLDENRLKKEGQDQPQPKYAESGIEKEEPSKVEGGMTGSDGGSGMAIIAVLGAIVDAVVAGLAVAGPIALGLAAVGVTMKDFYDLAQLWDLKKNTAAGIKEGVDHENSYLEQAAKRRGMTVPQMLEDNKKKGGVGSQQTEDLYTGKLQRDSYNVPYAPLTHDAKGIVGESMERNFNEYFGIENKGTFIKTKTSTSGDALEQGASESSAPTIIAPTTNNITNHNGGGGGSSKSSDLGMPSARTPNPTFRDTEAKRQTRQF